MVNSRDTRLLLKDLSNIRNATLHRVLQNDTRYACTDRDQITGEGRRCTGKFWVPKGIVRDKFSECKWLNQCRVPKLKVIANQIIFDINIVADLQTA